jgi:hypothetical protein
MMGLKQKILSAASEEEVNKLVAEGKTYEFASVKTRNSWKSAATRRLKGAKYTPTVAEVPAKKRKARRSR